MLSPKRTPIRRSADLSKETLQTTTEGLVTYSTLTQGKAVPREGQERAREKVLPTESQQILGGERPSQAPSTSGNESQGPGQGLGNLYTWDCTSTDLYKQRDKSFIGRTDVEAETPILRPPDVKS